MPWFREPDGPIRTSIPVDLVPVAAALDPCFSPESFVCTDDRWEWTAARGEVVAWEIFQGRLLDARHTREQRSFLAWSLHEKVGDGLAGEAVLSLKLDPRRREVHVVRGILSYAWETTTDPTCGDDPREVRRWLRELVGTIRLADLGSMEELIDETECLLWQAIVGTSRLPLTSVEAPHPHFILGRLHYVGSLGRGSGDPLLHRIQSKNRDESCKAVEFLVRTTPTSEIPRVATEQFRSNVDTVELSARECSDGPRAPSAKRNDLTQLFLDVFNLVSLSPWTGFVDNAFAWVEVARGAGRLAVAEVLDFFATLSLQIARHLTAYDLVTFHHRGANYPDALLLERLLESMESLIRDCPASFTGGDPSARRARSALRSAWLLRATYEGHAVPSHPTSAGENTRVWPERFEHLSENEMNAVGRRPRLLFAGQTLAEHFGEKEHEPAFRSIFEACHDDLTSAEAWREFGLAWFIDRPLGYEKVGAEPDQTPLLASEAFSASIARQRLERWSKLAAGFGLSRESTASSGDPSPAVPFSQEAWRVSTGQADVVGAPATKLSPNPRPVVCLADMNRVATDFVVRKTLPGGVRKLLGRLDLSTLRERLGPGVDARLLRSILANIGGPAERTLTWLDRAGTAWMTWAPDWSAGGRTRAGMELPAKGVVATLLGSRGEVEGHVLLNLQSD